MGILEDMIMKAKSVAETVGEKTGNFVDVSKLNISIAEEKNELKKKYEVLGKYVYDSEKAGIDSIFGIKEYVSEIDRTKKSIDKMEKEVSILKNQVMCSKCGNRNSSDSKFCNNCGSELAIKCQVIKKESPINN